MTYIENEQKQSSSGMLDQYAGFCQATHYPSTVQIHQQHEVDEATE